jgi:hypothetical protein
LTSYLTLHSVIMLVVAVHPDNYGHRVVHRTMKFRKY